MSADAVIHIVLISFEMQNNRQFVFINFSMAEEGTNRRINMGSNIPSIAATKQASVTVAMFGVRMILETIAISLLTTLLA